VDITAWLRRLGLEQYEQAFRENDIDAEVLPELTAEDLIGLGVISIGHRRKLLAAIAALRGQSTPASEKTGPITSTAPKEDPSGSASSGAEAASTHGDVLRSGRLDRALVASRRGESAANSSLKMPKFPASRGVMSNSAAAAWRLWPYARRNRSWTTTAVSLAGALSGSSPTVTP
jgi:hypothetical protein